IKSIWCEKLELAIPKLEGSFTLETDASDEGLGAVLKQEDLPIVYISRMLRENERAYSVTEKETLAAIWAMEKLEYYLMGKEFVLVTDHKAILELKKKSEFGSNRIKRWFERIERFQFKVDHRAGQEMVQADALSRGAPRKSNENQIQGGGEDILKIHKDMGHRKGILDEIKEKGIFITSKKLKEILGRCEVCKRKDKKYEKTNKFIETSFPGEKFAVDIMEVENGEKIVLGIDFFSRKIYGNVLSSKEGKKIVNFLERCKRSIKLVTVVTDNGREFKNNLVQRWMINNGIEHQFSIPYYHESNGRIERANRTIREMLKKSKGLLKVRLGKAISTYNKVRHRGIGMSPDQAMLPENRNKVLEVQERYKREFVEGKCEEFK
ncbi:MAG: RNase H-like domain-containing protein, partial [Bacteroidales bacterium]